MSSAEVRNPYKGLRAFGEEDAEDFFGRQATVDQLVAALAAGTRLVALVGPSGSGKSSVLAAGLVPAIRAGAVPGSAPWVAVSMVPGRRPAEALETALAGPPAGAADVLVLVDQFEEVFSLPDDAERGRFLDHLVRLVTGSEDRVRVALTLRADHYDRVLPLAEFGLLFTRGQVNVLPMAAEELAAAVGGPATRVGIDVEPALVAALVADAVAQPSTLPHLQFALTEMFDHRAGHGLTLDEYRALGGLRGLLARRADQTYAGLDAGRRSWRSSPAGSSSASPAGASPRTSPSKGPPRIWPGGERPTPHGCRDRPTLTCPSWPSNAAGPPSHSGCKNKPRCGCAPTAPDDGEAIRRSPTTRVPSASRTLPTPLRDCPPCSRRPERRQRANAGSRRPGRPRPGRGRRG